MPEATGTTQQFVEIKEIKNGVLRLKKGGLRRVLMVGGINFDLKSEAEQTLILQSFQNFLNSLDFSLQFFIHSRKTNIASYLEKMEGRKNEEENELLKIQIGEYTNFIRSFVEQNAIITKTFFVVVPYEPVILSKEMKGIFGVLKGGQKKKETASEEVPPEHLEQLNHRVDQVVNGLSGIGLRAAPLENEELIELYYNLYNPQLVEKKELEIAKEK